MFKTVTKGLLMLASPVIRDYNGIGTSNSSINGINRFQPVSDGNEKSPVPSLKRYISLALTLNSGFFRYHISL